MNKIKLLLAEDDQDLGAVLKEYLQLKQYDVMWAQDGEDALKLFETEPPSICVLDIMMPKLDGFSVAQIIKKREPNMPFVFLTAKSLKEDKYHGLQLGAADYITKPFDPEELVLRLNNILSRYATPSTNSDIICVGKTQLDCSLLRLVCNENTIELTEKEAELLKYLFSNSNKVLERNTILDEVWGDDDYFVGRSMDVFISRVRKYLAKDHSLLLRTVRGKGFILESR